MFAKTISAVALFTALGVAGATAQSRSGPIIPAEMPPPSFTGTQYVDSRGCVFIRAGFDGRVTWVPRYGDDRRPMCGFEPSLASAAAPSQPAPSQPAATPVAQTPVTTFAAAPASPRPVPTMRPRASGEALAATGGVPWSVPPEPARPPRTAGSGAAPVHTVSGPAGLDTRWSFYDRTGPGPCAHLSPHSQLYMVPSPARPELPIRCGPQAQHPADAVNELAPRGGVWEPWDGVNPSPMAPNVYQRSPAYSPSWPDAHLRGQPAPAQHASAPARQVTVSSMGSAAPQTVAPSGRYVQVGTFGVEANARATIARLQAQGLPVATGRAQRGGQALQTVMVGPLGSQSEVGAALGAARALGFHDAFVR